jgi:hypothetical protein
MVQPLMVVIVLRKKKKSKIFIVYATLIKVPQIYGRCFSAMRKTSEMHGDLPSWVPW